MIFIVSIKIGTLNYAQGIDMVKVDSQSGLQEYTPKKTGYVGLMRDYQRALQGAAHTQFEGNLLHCMSNSIDVAYHMSSSVAWRNLMIFTRKSQKAMRAIWLLIPTMLYGRTPLVYQIGICSKPTTKRVPTTRLAVQSAVAPFMSVIIQVSRILNYWRAWVRVTAACYVVRSQRYRYVVRFCRSNGG